MATKGRMNGVNEGAVPRAVLGCVSVSVCARILDLSVWVAMAARGEL